MILLMIILVRIDNYFISIVNNQKCMEITGTYFLTCLANRRRHQKINLVDQFIMAYGGLRGAICYGLVMTLDKDAVLAKEMFTSTTIIVILTTTFLQVSMK